MTDKKVEKLLERSEQDEASEFSATVTDALREEEGAEAAAPANEESAKAPRGLKPLIAIMTASKDRSSIP
jgi:hypothetical protein